MSSDVMSTGIMVPLNRKLTEEERDEWSEELYDQGDNVNFNYEGTLAYTDEGGEAYGISFGVKNDFDVNAFDCLEKYGLGVQMKKARPYRCMWYNGADSDMDMMELEDFLLRTGQSA